MASKTNISCDAVSNIGTSALCSRSSVSISVTVSVKTMSVLPFRNAVP